MYTKDDYFNSAEGPYGWNEADWQMSIRYENRWHRIDEGWWQYTSVRRISRMHTPLVDA